MYQKGLFLAVILLTGDVFATAVGAAPTVKTFGNATSSSAYGTIRSNRDSMTQPSITNKRAASARSLGLTTKPTTKVASVTTNTNTAPKATGSIGSARAPGLHGNILKGISSKLSSNNPSQPVGPDTSDLEQRVAALEAEMPTKQDILEPGDGIDITGTTISLSEDVATLSDKVDEMAQDIEDLNDRVDPEKYYTIEKTQEYLQENYYTRDDVDQITGQISKPDIVDDFDPTFLTKGN